MNEKNRRVPSTVLVGLVILCLAGLAVYFALGASGQDLPISGSASLPGESSHPALEGETIPAQYSCQYANMHLTLPEGWTYRAVPYDALGEKHSAFGLEFWREDQPEVLFRFNYYPQGIGLCGTGKTFEEVSFSNGLTATKCTEILSEDTLWMMVIFADLPGTYALETLMPHGQWADYEGAITEILESAALGQGCLRQSEAVRLAEAACTVDYDTTWADFDFSTGVWQVRFYQTGTIGADQTVRLDPEGAVIETIYGS